jgi:hypothetical protein
MAAEARCAHRSTGESGRWSGLGSNLALIGKLPDVRRCTPASSRPLARMYSGSTPTTMAGCERD